MTGVLALHEVFHETKKNGEVGIVLKLDFENTCDKVGWEFLLKCLELRGFNETWCSWIRKIVENDKVSAKLNNKAGRCYQSYKGVT